MHAPVCIYEAICRHMLFSHYLHKLCDETKFEQWCPLSLMGTISLTIAQIVILSTKPLNGLRQFKRLNSWGGCMQPQGSQIGRRLHLSEFKTVNDNPTTMRSSLG